VGYQPVVEIAKAIGMRLTKPVNLTAVKKIKDTPELKNIFDYEERSKLLQGAFKIDSDAVGGKRILLIDDLYRSGATTTVVTQALLGSGAAAVYMLAITKTRTRT
jgi:predicted amidophosphoribosyltransferase